MNNQKPPITVDLNKIPNMKCYCGSDIFTQVFNLKYISPILCGDPQGGTAHVFMWRCSLCGQLYPKATTADEINKIYQKLPPERKAFIDELKLKLKENKDATARILEGGGIYPPEKKE